MLEEVPRVRKDFGYPPPWSPRTSQMVGSQAVLNVLSGDRYKMVTKSQGTAPRRVRPAARRGQRGSAEEGHRQR